MTIQLVASMLTADMAALGEECRRLDDAGVDGIHWDIMDGKAVPALSFGPDVVSACRGHTGVPFEAHVMVRDPDPLLKPLRDAGCELVTVHPDLLSHPWRTAERIHELGLRCGMALSPAIGIDQVRWLLPVIERVLVMTVEPGFGGQRYLTSLEAKVRELDAVFGTQAGTWELQVDGGIAPETIAGAHEAGAGVFVVGSALWRAETLAAGVQTCRRACGVAVPTTAAGGRR